MELSDKVVECVPNFSEGCNAEVIQSIAKAISETMGCVLVDVDASASTNRTVYTFFGNPETVIEGALNGAIEASKHIDMKNHQGSHPRLGALDVCPFIPVKGVTMEDCIKCTHQFSERLVKTLNVPVYLYGYASREDYRKTVPQIRSGQYENLCEKLKDDRWKPDYGPAEFVPSWGASIVGARDFLIAYNVNIMSTKEQAHRIALNIRSTGRGPSQPGLLEKIQAVGWREEKSNISQISVNVLDFKTTAVHTVFETCVEEAKKLNLPITGSQVVGLIPLKVMFDAANYYIAKEDLFIVEEDQKLRLVIDRLGLNSLGQFNTDEKIIEYVIGSNKHGSLASLPLHEFIKSLSSRTPSPGGGSASAAVAAIGAALSTMVGWMTFGKKKYDHLDSTMRKLIPPIREVMVDLIPLVDADTNAFNMYMEALKLPKSSPDEKERQAKSVQEGLMASVDVPLRLIQTVTRIWEPLKALAKHGNIQTKSDIQVGVRCLEAGVWGAYYNIAINLPDITDESYKEKVKVTSTEGLECAKTATNEVLEILDLRQN
ncbi:formimidoyltransferase-cyclodeaminase-like [Xenia sp. Carnegie-2017]|uniref:formimidoyltransferase-cyclodeaminase-like n=1 Tax=Xenia sp. Carnegie-2017 TaxID=2897299 RepID=UPI001F04F2F2|nr:formimidoyltransferase-cyclodeaminase-like [Xenia sp. Carnegie-2017]